MFKIFNYSKNLRHNTRNFRTGFTLVELLVVISIIGLLSSVILSALNSARAKAEDNKHIQSLSQLKRAMELYYDQNGSYPQLPVASSWRINSWDAPGNFFIPKDNNRLAALAPYLSSRPSGKIIPPFCFLCGGYFYKVSTNGQEYKITLMRQGTVNNISNIPQNMQDTAFSNGGTTDVSIYSSETSRAWVWWNAP